MSKERIKLQLVDRQEYRRVLIQRKEEIELKLSNVEEQIRKLKEEINI